jgi:hypothetical protein
MDPCHGSRQRLAVKAVGLNNFCRGRNAGLEKLGMPSHAADRDARGFKRFEEPPSYIA